MTYRDYSAALGRCLGSAGISGDRESPTAKRAARACAGLLAVMTLCGCNHEEVRLVLTRPMTRDTVIMHTYVCQIHSSRRTEVRAQTPGYLKVVNAREGQRMKSGEEMFKILPQVPSAAATREEKEDGMTSIKAPFTGLMSRLRKQNGSQVDAGDVLTTLSDNSVMWADFNVPEAHLTESPAAVEGQEVRLMLVNGRMFDQPGRVGPVKAEAVNLPGSQPFRAVFPNPKDLLRHGETGTIRMETTLKKALLVPRTATFERAGHQCLYVVGKDHVIRQRQLSITHELGDFFVVSAGVNADDTILLEGLDKVHDGEKAGKSTFVEPAAAYAHLKLKAE